ncbi:hypothetical protein L3Q82_014266 [Scortum barcoo]|uniref:Uncharacterized protein n=2 Tax=Scortum barcoo TaxID=214431 RepID=A0ACB8VWG2_9TELE|nr:hypothetical protein L3Q82_014266 [Scortum barcoo]
MSAVWLKLITIVCLSCTALSGPERSEVVWKEIGGAFTIQCRSEPNQEFLTLRRGIREDIQIFYKVGTSEKNEIAAEFRDRLQFNGVFPNIDLLIKNLTSDDTGPYWCEYARFDSKSAAFITKKGNGSVLLVVRGEPHQSLY